MRHGRKTYKKGVLSDEAEQRARVALFKDICEVASDREQICLFSRIIR